MLRIIGDVHNFHEEYCTIAQEAEYSICVGDVGFDYTYITNNLDPEKHKIIGGNHDNYEFDDTKTNYHEKYFKQSRHFLGDFGTYNVPNFCDIFYVRGAWSIDQKNRTIGIDWFPCEELTRAECDDALELYQTVKPEFVITHEAPFSLLPYVTSLEVAKFLVLNIPTLKLKRI